MDRPDTRHLNQNWHHQQWDKMTSKLMKRCPEKNTISLLHILAKTAIKWKDRLQIDDHYLHPLKWLVQSHRRGGQNGGHRDVEGGRQMRVRRVKHTRQKELWLGLASTRCDPQTMRSRPTLLKPTQFLTKVALTSLIKIACIVSSKQKLDLKKQINR